MVAMGPGTVEGVAGNSCVASVVTYKLEGKRPQLMGASGFNCDLGAMHMARPLCCEDVQSLCTMALVGHEK